VFVGILALIKLVKHPIGCICEGGALHDAVHLSCGERCLK